jgi:hypothetical protein
LLICAQADVESNLAARILDVELTSIAVMRRTATSRGLAALWLFGSRRKAHFLLAQRIAFF